MFYSFTVCKLLELRMLNNTKVIWFRISTTLIINFIRKFTTWAVRLLRHLILETIFTAITFYQCLPSIEISSKNFANRARRNQTNSSQHLIILIYSLKNYTSHVKLYEIDFFLLSKHPTCFSVLTCLVWYISSKTNRF